MMIRDLFNEIVISWHLYRLVNTRDKSTIQHHASMMAKHIRMRSPRQIAKMEKRLGL